MNDYRFNRQELFTKDDMRELMDIISDVELHRDDFDGKYKFKNDMLVNQLFGMFDGVLYDNVLNNSNMAMLPLNLIRRIDVLVEKIVNSLVKTHDEVVG